MRVTWIPVKQCDECRYYQCAKNVYYCEHRESPSLRQQGDIRAYDRPQWCPLPVMAFTSYNSEYVEMEMP